MADSKGSAQDVAAEERSASDDTPKPPKTPRGGGKGPGDNGPRKGTKERRPNPISRLIRFIREVVAELRKVIWPTRKELITYTSVVVVFVTVMTAIVWGLDAGVAKLVMWAFGANSDS
ncbi:preprotein translocase subunit SecE [Cryptosporangium arvum]|uniref:preprotein translocase subunit SecE n=1 Tax=Cryptosporangium arvum TaxID=80871 RepID=UPI0004B7AF91|nr:preprotein translocase subunit SecE [Cryptosporangium arvum]